MEKDAPGMRGYRSRNEDGDRKDGDVGSNATSSHATQMNSALTLQLLWSSFPQPQPINRKAQSA